jgi:mannose-6-phosphate isomerase-like protein (cupin superfamily)
MIITKVSETAIVETPLKVDVRRIYSQKDAQVSHLHLKPGQSLKPHITPVDVFFYILEGTPDIMVGEETITVEKDSIVESPKDIIHCIYNNSDKDIRVLVVKTPRP